MLPATRTFRSRQAALRALLEPQLAAVWPVLDPERVDETFPAWSAQAGAIVLAHRTVSAAIGARYLRELGVTVTAGVKLPTDVLMTSLGVTGPTAIKQGMTAGKTLGQAAADALALSSMAAARHVLDGGREIVRASSTADRRVRGWQRVAAGNACDFCQSKTGTVFTDPSADFSCHDGCNCSLEPIRE